jgi:Flp pilus assembly protein TadB
MLESLLLFIIANCILLTV